MPFFPGGYRGSEDDGGNGFGFGQHTFREQDRSSVSSHSISPSDYRSIKSSPSPPQARVQEVRHQPSPGPREGQRQSPTIRQSDAGKAYPAIEARIIREGSMLGSLGTLPEGEGTNHEEEDEERMEDGGHQTPGPGSSFYSSQHQQQALEQPPLHPVALSHSGRSFSGVTYSSASPVSSLDSNNRVILGGMDSTQNFETQLKSSPLFHDILDRLVRCEYTTREIQRDLGDINHKVNLLVERALGGNGQPEFNNPFATSAASSSILKPRPSAGNIAPNQAANTDDITSISQRLSTLTSSVGQLLALQTQQMQQTVVPEGRGSVININTQMDLAPNQGMPPNSSMIGHGLPGRPDPRPSPRQPNPPMRTWSAGNLELPARPSIQDLGRQDSLLRDKRRSVSGLLRRDSSGVSLIFRVMIARC